MNIDEIEKLAEDYSRTYDELEDIVESANSQIRAVKRGFLKQIRAKAELAANKKLVLQQAIEESPDAFKKPKTRTMHGIKFGLTKGKGKLQFDSAEKVVKKIRQLYDDQIGTLIKVEEKPNKDALAKLPAEDLKKLGITITGTGDQVVIKRTDGELDKLVDALMDDEELDQEAA